MGGAEHVHAKVAPTRVGGAWHVPHVAPRWEERHVADEVGERVAERVALRWGGARATVSGGGGISGLKSVQNNPHRDSHSSAHSK